MDYNFFSRRVKKKNLFYKKKRKYDFIIRKYHVSYLFEKRFFHLGTFLFVVNENYFVQIKKKKE